MMMKKELILGLRLIQTIFFPKKNMILNTSFSTDLHFNPYGPMCSHLLTNKQTFHHVANNDATPQGK